MPTSYEYIRKMKQKFSSCNLHLHVETPVSTLLSPFNMEMTLTQLGDGRRRERGQMTYLYII